MFTRRLIVTANYVSIMKRVTVLQNAVAASKTRLGRDPPLKNKNDKLKYERGIKNDKS